jgi:glycerate 2-kinase
VTRLRTHAQQIFQAGITAADPYAAVKRCLNLGSTAQKIHLLAFGKAACAMSRAALELVPAEQLVGQGIVVTNYENVSAIENCVVIGAGHPLPNADGFLAAQKIAECMQLATADELVLVLISGGGSALLPYPVAGVSLAEKIATTDLLLSCGATINEINCVRKHLSQLKGGGLAKLAYPAKVHALILSDVLGDDLSTIASGTTVPDTTTYTAAINVLKIKGIWLIVPESVRQHLLQGEQGLIAETPKPNDPIFHNIHHVLCASNAVSVQAMLSKAEQLGYQTQIYSEQLCGIAKDEADKLAQYATQIVPTLQRRNAALLAGGETTVNLTGNGKGGRNQEFALAFALAAKKHGLPEQWTLLSGGTDGRDGPTDAAGGMVDAESLQRMIKAGCDPKALLNNNDAYTALRSSNDLLMTGATGTNVADLQILLLHPLGDA